jgi:hypothetical protein
MIFLLLEMVGRMVRIRAWRHRTDGEAKDRPNEPIPEGTAS